MRNIIEDFLRKRAAGNSDSSELVLGESLMAGASLDGAVVGSTADDRSPRIPQQRSIIWRPELCRAKQVFSRLYIQGPYSGPGEFPIT